MGDGGYARPISAVYYTVLYSCTALFAFTPIKNMPIDEKRAVAARPPDHPGPCDQHVAVAIGSVGANKVLAVDKVFPTGIAIALESCRAKPLTVMIVVVLMIFMGFMAPALLCTALALY